MCGGSNVPPRMPSSDGEAAESSGTGLSITPFEFVFAYVNRVARLDPGLFQRLSDAQRRQDALEALRRLVQFPVGHRGSPFNAFATHVIGSIAITRDAERS